MMKNCIVALLLLLSIARAQDVPPPPKPADDGPSLEVTMKFIQDKLNGQGTVNYVSIPHNGRTTDDPIKISNTVSEVSTNPATCAFDGNITSVSSNGRRDFRRTSFSFREVEKLDVAPWADALNKKNAESGHSELVYEFTPSIFSLTVQMLPGKLVREHEHIVKPGEPSADSDRSRADQAQFFRDEDVAQRVAKAMAHAVEFCGGGSKEPF